MIDVIMYDIIFSFISHCSHFSKIIHLYQIFFNLTQLSFIFQDSSCVFCIPSTISLHMTSEPPPPPEFKCNQQFCMFFTAESMNEYSVALIMVYCSLLHSPNFVNAKGSCRIENQRQ